MRKANEPLLSVIVPVYNSEPYLVECVNSIIHQTYHNLEIILVNDGSTDSSPSLCEALAAMDERIRVIHRENGGISVARNTGLDEASGQVITFVDNDDVLHPSMYATLYSAMRTHDADIASCAFSSFKNGQMPLFNLTRKPSGIVESGQEYGRSLICRDDPSEVVIWKKLYARHLFTEKKNRFPAGRYYEDNIFTLDIALEARIVVHLADTLYAHRVHERSAWTLYAKNDALMMKRYADLLYVGKRQLSSSKKYQLQMTPQIVAGVIDLLLGFFHEIVLRTGNAGSSSQYMLLRDAVLRDRAKHLLNPHLSLKRKLEIIALSIGPSVYVPMVSIAREINKRRGLVL